MSVVESVVGASAAEEEVVATASPSSSTRTSSSSCGASPVGFWSGGARSPGSGSVVRRTWETWLGWGGRLVRWYLGLTPLRRALCLLGLLAGMVLAVTALVLSHRFFAWLAPLAKSWRQLRGGWLIVFALVFVTAFPPLMGYSTANTIAGLVYGFPLGWPIVAAACVLGSLCAFLACRTVLSRRVDRIVGSDRRFVALGHVLRRDGILYLTAIRLCPLPYSLSNGFLASVPSITPLAFTFSTALSTPKLLIHVFIGSRLAILAEKGDKMTTRDKAINYLSMAVGAAIGMAVGLIIYRRTMARAAQLDRHQRRAHPAGDVEAAEQPQPGYDDVDDDPDDMAALLDPEDAAAVMSDDDMSLWETSRLKSDDTCAHEGPSHSAQTGG